MKGINNANLVVEPHPSNVDETIIVVCTSSGEATIWHLIDPRCNCKRSQALAMDGLRCTSHALTKSSALRRSQPKRLGKFEFYAQTMVGVGVSAVCGDLRPQTCIMQQTITFGLSISSL